MKGNFVVVIVVSVFGYNAAFLLPTKDTCIPLPDCFPAVDFLLRKPFDPFTIKVLQLSHCGNYGDYPKVRCENIVVPCKTPNNKQGICLPISECPFYLTLAATSDLSNPSTKRLLRGYRCNPKDTKNVEVCCPDLRSREVIDKSPFPEPGKCGIRGDEDDRIVGGELAELGEFPWMAMLVYKKGRRDEPACAGSLVSERHVLTAAHCADEEFLKGVGYKEIDKVVLGEYDTRTNPDCVDVSGNGICAPNVQSFKVERYVLHPGWKSKQYDDIAILRLDSKVSYNDFVQPICLPEKGIRLNGSEELFISGWGRTENLRSSPVKRKATIKIANKTSCRRLSENQICAGGTKGRDTCVGDSGGPLMLLRKINGMFLAFIIGIVSSGPSFCGSAPAIYTYVPNYLDWINQVVNFEDIFF